MLSKYIHYSRCIRVTRGHNVGEEGQWSVRSGTHSGTFPRNPRAWRLRSVIITIRYVLPCTAMYCFVLLCTVGPGIHYTGPGSRTHAAADAAHTETPTPAPSQPNPSCFIAQINPLACREPTAPVVPSFWRMLQQSQSPGGA